MAPITGTPGWRRDPLKIQKNRLLPYTTLQHRTATVTSAARRELRSRTIKEQRAAVHGTADPVFRCFPCGAPPWDPASWPTVGPEVAAECTIATSYLVSLWEASPCPSCEHTALTTKEIIESGAQLFAVLTCGNCGATHDTSSEPPYTNAAMNPVAPACAPSVQRKIFAMLHRGKTHKDFLISATGVEMNVSKATWDGLRCVWAHAVRLTTEEGLDRGLHHLKERPNGARGWIGAAIVSLDGMYSVRSLKKSSARSPSAVVPMVDVVSRLLIACSTPSQLPDNLFFDEPAAFKRDGVYPYGEGAPDFHSGDDTDTVLHPNALEARGAREGFENLKERGVKVAVALCDGDLGLPLHLRKVYGKRAHSRWCWLHKCRTLWNKIKDIGPQWVQSKKKKGSKKNCSCDWNKRADGSEGETKNHTSCNQSIAEAVQVRRFCRRACALLRLTAHPSHLPSTHTHTFPFPTYTHRVRSCTHSRFSQ